MNTDSVGSSGTAPEPKRDAITCTPHPVTDVSTLRCSGCSPTSQSGFSPRNYPLEYLLICFNNFLHVLQLNQLHTP